MNADRSAVAGPLAYDDTSAFSVAELLEERGPSGARRRGWVIRRALAAADIAGLALAFVLAGDPHRWWRHRRTRAAVRGVAAGLDRRRQALRIVRQRRRANRSLAALTTSSACSTWSPSGRGSFSRPRARSGSPELSGTCPLLGLRRSGPHRRPLDACAVSAKRRVRPEHAHRRGGAGRTACRQEAPSASGVQGERRRIRGRAPRHRIDGLEHLSVLDRRRSSRRSFPVSTSTASSSRSPTTRTRRPRDHP